MHEPNAPSRQASPVQPAEASRDALALRVLSYVDAGLLPRTTPHPCPYLPDRTAREQAFRVDGLDPGLYHDLMDRNFRRSGDLFYAADCPGCRACRQIRVPVAGFVPSKSQRRAWRRNRDITMRVGPLDYDDTKADLYRRYLRAQHPRSPGIDREEGPRDFLYQRVVDTVEACYFLGDALVAVSILDVCPRSVSSVYHYFDPAHAKRSLGVHSVLAEIAWAREMGVPHYYLGYWIDGAETMAYKADYQPHEVLVEGEWVGQDKASDKSK